MTTHRSDGRPQTGGSGAANVEFSHYSEIFRRRWLVVVLCVLVGTGLAVAALSTMTKTYQSTASVLVAASTSSSGSVENGRTSSSLNLDTEAQIVTSSTVASLAADSLDSSAPRELAKKTTVSVPANTSVLDIAFKATTPEAARDGAQAFADAYLKNRRELAQARIDGQQDSVEKRVEALNDELEKAGQAVQALPVGSAAREFQASRRDLLVRQIAAVNEQLVSIQASDSAPGTIITDPQLPTQAIAPNAKIVLASGVMAGLLVGLILAFLVDRRDRRIRDARDLSRMGLEPLVPYVLLPPAGDIAPAGSQRYDAEPMRMLRNSLLAQMPGHRGSVMVAAASKGTEGSGVALNLAATLARTGLEVIFVSADPGIGSHRMTAADHGGLAGVIHERVDLDEVLQSVEDEPGLKTLAQGMGGSMYSELVQSERLQSVLVALFTKADILVFDVAPVSENADAQTLAAHFDGVVLVASAWRTTTDDIERAVDQLRHVSARVFGAVLAQEASPSAARRDTGPSA